MMPAEHEAPNRPALFQGLIFGPLNQSMQDAGDAVAAEQVTLSVTGRLASGTNAQMQILSHSLWTNTRRRSAVMTSRSRAAGSKRSRSK
jgi:hypothetical protein